jgi:hypothetical protein
LAGVLGPGAQNDGALDEGQIGHAGQGQVRVGWWRPSAPTWHRLTRAFFGPWGFAAFGAKGLSR